MILSDREIQAAIKRGLFRIDPFPLAKSWSSTAVDLGLDGQIRRWKDPQGGMQQIVCPASSDFNYTKLADGYTEVFDIPTTGFDLVPRSFVLGWTIEKIQLPHQSKIAARVEGKSSLSRLGLGVHVTAPTIHAGFGYNPRTDNGLPIQLEIWNVGNLTIKLLRGMPICQLIFEEVHGTPDKGYEGMFSSQGPQGQLKPAKNRT